MKILGSPNSPFVRKVRVFAAEKGFDAQFVLDRPSHPGSRVAESNPLGKVPVLLLDDGEAIYDSVVIVEYLEGLQSSPQLIPTDLHGRMAVRRLEALADGIAEAAINISHDRGPMKDAQKQAAWIPNQQAKIERALAHVEHSLPGREWLHGDSFSLADIAAGYAVAYVDHVLPALERPKRFPGLAPYIERLMARPSFRSTAPGK